MDPLKTQFEMKEIIERCFEECERAGQIKRLSKQEQYIAEFETNRYDDIFEHPIIVNLDGVCDHISKTLIGELLEFEILRKLGPVIRQQRSIERDIEILEKKHMEVMGLQELRINKN